MMGGLGSARARVACMAMGFLSVFFVIHGVDDVYAILLDPMDMRKKTWGARSC